MLSQDSFLHFLHFFWDVRNSSGYHPGGQNTHKYIVLDQKIKQYRLVPDSFLFFRQFIF